MSYHATRDRTLTAVVRGVDANRGVVTVFAPSINAVVEARMTHEAFAVGSSYGGWYLRAVPPVGASCRVSFDAKDVAFVDGYGGFGPGPNGEALEGYSRGQERAAWRQLQPGELEARSVGGAGWFLSAAGQAVLEAGASAVVLDAPRREVAVTADERLRIDAGASMLVLGRVERLDPTGLVDLSGGRYTALEFDLVRTTAPGAPSLPLVSVRAGDVVDGLGLPGANAFEFTLYGPLANAIFGIQTSLAGSTTITALAGLTLASSPLASPERSVLGESLVRWLTTSASFATGWGPTGPALAPAETLLDAFTSSTLKTG